MSSESKNKIKIDVIQKEIQTPYWYQVKNLRYYTVPNFSPKPVLEQKGPGFEWKWQVITHGDYVEAVTFACEAFGDTYRRGDSINTHIRGVQIKYDNLMADAIEKNIIPTPKEVINGMKREVDGIFGAFHLRQLRPPLGLRITDTSKDFVTWVKQLSLNKAAEEYVALCRSAASFLPNNDIGTLDDFLSELSDLLPNNYTLKTTSLGLERSEKQKSIQKVRKK